MERQAELRLTVGRTRSDEGDRLDPVGAQAFYEASMKVENTTAWMGCMVSRTCEPLENAR